MKNQLSKIKSNAPGAAIGGVALYLIASKVGGIHNILGLVGIAAVGVLIGANVQDAMKGTSLKGKE